MKGIETYTGYWVMQIFGQNGCWAVEELDVKDLLVEPTEFIREAEYSKNLLDDLLNNDDLLGDL